MTTVSSYFKNFLILNVQNFHQNVQMLIFYIVGK